MEMQQNIPGYILHSVLSHSPLTHGVFYIFFVTCKFASFPALMFLHL